jgi:hypothetical protein
VRTVLNRRADAAKLRDIKAWTREVLRLSDEVAVMVTELKCSEPDCPPLETLIAVLHGSSRTAQYRIAAALDAVDWPQVAAALLGRSDGCTKHQQTSEEE